MIADTEKDGICIISIYVQHVYVDICNTCITLYRNVKSVKI